MTTAFDAAFQALLTGHAGLASIVGDRIYPEFIPQEAADELPVIVRVMAFSADQNLDAGAPAVSFRATFELYCTDPTHRLNINEQLFDCLAGYSNHSGLGGVPVRHIQFESFEPVQVEASPDQQIFAAVISYTGLLDFTA